MEVELVFRCFSVCFCTLNVFRQDQPSLFGECTSLSRDYERATKAWALLLNSEKISDDNGNAVTAISQRCTTSVNESDSSRVCSREYWAHLASISWQLCRSRNIPPYLTYVSIRFACCGFSHCVCIRRYQSVQHLFTGEQLTSI